MTGEKDINVVLQDLIDRVGWLEDKLTYLVIELQMLKHAKALEELSKDD